MWWWQCLSRVPGKYLTKVINLPACLPAKGQGKLISSPSLQLISGSLGPGTRQRSLADYSIHWVARIWLLQELEHHRPGLRRSQALARTREDSAALY